MEPSIPAPLLESAGAFIAAKMGLHFPPARRADLERALTAAAAELGFADGAACAQWLPGATLSKSQMETLTGHLTIGETYFYREPRSFEILREEILPRLIAERRRRGELRLRIWSAACCTGEEPYSIAIALREVLPDWREWTITLLATDINTRVLRKAVAGVFSKWSFRAAPAGMQERYFQPTPDGHFAILPEIRRMVQFSYLNLAEDVYPSPASEAAAMDVIFCRNVLMYFTPAQTRQVIKKLHASQVEDGWLFVSPSESPYVAFPSYATVHFPGAVLYQKRPAGSVAKPLPQWPTSDVAAIAPPPPVAPPVAWSSSETIPAFLEAAALEIPLDALRSLAESPALDAMKLQDRARELANAGKLDEALGCCDACLKLDRLDPAAHYLRAIVLLERGAAEDAIQTLQRVLYLDPKFTLALLALGNIARGQSRPAEAEKWHRHALEALRGVASEAVVPASDGVTTARLRVIIESLMNLEVSA